jgi:hypothetical protein
MARDPRWRPMDPLPELCRSVAIELEEFFAPVVGFVDTRSDPPTWWENTRTGLIPLVGTPRGWHPLPRRGARAR